MSGSSPNFAYWRRFDTYSIWETACLISGLDPRAMSDEVDEHGFGLTLDDEIKELISAAYAETLNVAPAQETPFNRHTLILRSSLLHWLPAHGYEKLANALQAPDSGNDGGTEVGITKEEKDGWKKEAVRIANAIGRERWKSGQREITARNIVEDVAEELGKFPHFHGNRGPRSSSDIRNRALRRWKFDPNCVDQSDSTDQPA